MKKESVECLKILLSLQTAAKLKPEQIIRIMNMPVKLCLIGFYIIK